MKRFHAYFVSALLLTGAEAAEIQVYAAASLKNALVEIAVKYERSHPDRLRFNLAGSNILAQQIKEGAPADLFISADEAKMNDLQQAHKIVPGSRKSLLTNTLVVVTSPGNPLNIRTAEDLASNAIRRLALAETRTVPAGIYARDYFVQQGIWSRIEKRVLPTENVKAALAAVESGNAEAGIVYRTDALSSPAIQIAYSIPENEGPKISYPVALIVDGKNPGPARQLLDYLSTKAALTVFEKHGFGVVR